MILLNIFVANLVITAAEITSICCEIKRNPCDDINGKKLIFYDAKPPEGYNIHWDVYMRFAIMLSEAKKRGKDNWVLVLPPWHNLELYSKTDLPVPRPWSDFFDIDSLETYAPVVEMHHIFCQTKKKVLEIDILYVLENYEDAFENGTYEEKWQIIGDCSYTGQFWGYNNISVKEILCVKFQGKNSKLWELISLHPHHEKVMFAHADIPLHDSYGTKTYWDCRKSMKFSKSRVDEAKEYASQYLNCETVKCNNYISVHYSKPQVPSVSGTVKQIRNTLKKLPNIKMIFIATYALYEFVKLEEEFMALGYETHLFPQSPTLIEWYGEDSIAIAFQILCSQAAYFIGTYESILTYKIQEEREILGFDSSTTFNRLCPDTGRCERMPKRIIVN